MPEAPEQRARRFIDAHLTAAGWVVQSREDLDLMAGRGIAGREFRMAPGFGFADYLHYGQVFNFPQPDTQLTSCGHDAQLRGRLQHLPPVDESRLWAVQGRAIRNLETSLARNDPRALVQLRVRSELDRGAYPKGVMVTEAQMATLRLERHRFHGDWNYTIHPAAPKVIESVIS